MTLNLYLISQDQNDGYDIYSDAVVAAENELKAKLIHPGGDTWVLIPLETALREGIQIEDVVDIYSWSDSGWTTPDLVDAKLIGIASEDVKEGVICASYHAG